MISKYPSRTVIITGGSKGIGAGISKAFYGCNDKVLIVARSDTGLARSLGDQAKFFKADLRNTEEANLAIQAAIDWTGRLDVLINSVGISGWRSLADIDESFFQNMFDTNLKSMFFTCKAASHYLGSGGVIINISSLAGKRGSANNSVYCATKFGVNALTQSLAKELGGRGIRVNAVCPVYVRTDGLEDALNDNNSPSLGLSYDDYLNNFAKTQTALGILPNAEQVSATCLFLASSSSSAITGQCLNVDCGVFPQ